VAVHSALESQRTPLRTRRIARTFAAAAVCLSLSIVLLVLALHSAPVRRFAIDRLTTTLAAQQIDLRVDDIRYNLLTLSIDARNLQLRSTASPDSLVFATVRGAHFDLSLTALLRRQLVVESARAEAVEIDYVVDESGGDNLPRRPPDPKNSGTPTKPLDYLIAHLSVGSARVRYANRAQQVDAVLPISQVELTGNALTGRHQLQFASTAATANIRERILVIDRIVGAIEIGADELKVDRLEAQFTGSLATATGVLRRFDAPELELSLRARIDAAKTAALLDVRDPVEGKIAIDARIGGPLSAPTVDVNLSGAKLAVRSLAEAELDVRGTYNAANHRADVQWARLQAPWGRVAANGQLSAVADGTSRAHVEISAVDIVSIMRGLELRKAVDARIDGTLDAQWPGLDFLATSGTATATLIPTGHPAAAGTMPVAGRIAADRRRRTLVADLQHFAVANANVTGRVSLTDDNRLDGKLLASVPDLTSTVRTLEAFLGRGHGSVQATGVAGATHIQARIGGSISEPTAYGSVTAPSISIGAVDGIAVASDMTLTPEALTIARAEADWKGAHAAFNGVVGLRDAGQIDLAFVASAKDLRELARAANWADAPVSGTISGRGTISGTVARPLGSLSLHGVDINAFDERFGSLNAEVALAGSDVTITQFVIEKPQPRSSGRISATASYNLDRESYTAELQSENLQLLTFTLPGGQHIRGDVQLVGKAAGTLSSPAGTATVAIDALQIDRLRAGSLNATTSQLPPAELGRVVINAAASDHRATIDASVDRFNVDAKAIVRLAHPWPATMSMRANGLDLATLPLDLWAPLDGHLRAALDATGDLAEPSGIRAVARIESMAGSWNGQPFEVTSTGELRYADEGVDIDRLQLTIADSTLVARGHMPITRATEGDLAIEARANLASLTPLLPSEAAVAADGVATVKGSLRGTLGSLTPDLVVTIENGVLLSPLLDPGAANLQLRARVADGAADIQQLTGNWGTAVISASGIVPLEALPLAIEMAQKGRPTTLKASVRDLNPAAIPGAPQGMSGRVTMELEAAATRGDPASLNGVVVFPQLEIAHNRLTLVQQDPSRISISSGIATVERLALSGSAGTMVAKGTIGLAGDRPVDVRAEGKLDVEALSALTKSIRTDGVATWTLAASGPLTAPELNGTVDLADATIASNDVNIAAANVDAQLDLTGRRIDLTRLRGEINGGAFEGSGHVTLGNRSISDVNLQFSAKGVAYDAPLNLRSLSNATVGVTRRGDEFVIDGQLTIAEAGLTADINLNDPFFDGLSARRTLDLTEARDPFLQRVRFNIVVNTASPVIIENNLARGEISADLRVVGTPYDPGLTGRLTLAEGGQLTLNARRYQVERGVITFVDERRITPSFDLALHTEASDYDVRIAVSGAPGKTETSWTSEPSLPEPDIMALLVTGRTLDEMRGEESEVARVQALTYLTGRVGSRFGGGLKRATGLSEVRIEPVLIANETDPTARLTIGQDVTDRAKLIYSTNLADSNDQIWVVEYDLTRRFQMRAVREREDDSYRGDFRHDIRFGGDPAPRRQPRSRVTIASITVTTIGAIDESEARKRFELEEGDTYDFFAARNGVERIAKLCLESGYLQSRIRLDRRDDNDRVHLTLRVTSGPRVDLRFEGATPSSDVRNDVRAAWHRGVFDRQRGNDGIEVLRHWLIDDKFLQAKVDYEVIDRNDERQVVFRIRPGPRSDKVVLVFEGASGINPGRLNDIIEEQPLERQLFTDPTEVTSLLQRFYREEGFLSATIAPPRYDFQGATARIIVAVQEGPRFLFRHVTVAGNVAYPADEIAKQTLVVPGTPFLPAAAEHALQRIRDLYWRKGYNDVRPEYSLGVDRTDKAVDVTFTVVEGQQRVLSNIDIEGNRRTSDHLVLGLMELAPDQPLDLAVLARSRRNLYGTGAFSIADITREDLEPIGDQIPVRLKVSVREVEPVQLRYGVSYDTEGGLGGILDLSMHNLLGKARVVGVQGRYDSELRDARIYVSQPSLRYAPRKTIASVYFREDLNPPTEQTDPFDISRSGASIQQDVQFRRWYTFSYGYRYELATTLEPSLGEGVTETVRLSPVSSSLTRETRDEALDASKGTFLSQSFSYSPGWLGSDRPYVKYYGQYFHYFPLQAPRREPFSDEILRPRLVFATGARVGLARGLGGNTPTSERFYAGGSTTLRGFEQNAVGPVGENNVPAGGNAVVVLNNELRLPLVRRLDGVLFVDVGNVYPDIKDISLKDFRESAGFGLRLRTRWVLLRADYGFVLDPRPGERTSRFYFNIGQAF
jgi:outer membrane protein assembly complex protein YaeT